MIRKYVRQSAHGAYLNEALYLMPHVRLPDPGAGLTWCPVLFTEADAIIDGLLELLVTVRRDGFASGPL